MGSNEAALLKGNQMFATLAQSVTPNLSGNLNVYNVYNNDGVFIGLYEAYDNEDAIKLAIMDNQ